MFNLRQQIGIRYDGSEVELKQWQVLFSDTLVGYLQQAEVAQIQALFEFPHDQLTEDVLELFAMQNSEKLGKDCKVLPPEQSSRKFVEEAMAIKQAEAESDE
jgi:hypothetical protein